MAAEFAGAASAIKAGMDGHARRGQHAAGRIKSTPLQLTTVLKPTYGGIGGRAAPEVVRD